MFNEIRELKGDAQFAKIVGFKLKVKILEIYFEICKHRWIVIFRTF